MKVTDNYCIQRERVNRKLTSKVDTLSFFFMQPASAYIKIVMLNSWKICMHRQMLYRCLAMLSMTMESNPVSVGLAMLEVTLEVEITFVYNFRFLTKFVNGLAGETHCHARQGSFFLFLVELFGTLVLSQYLNQVDTCIALDGS